jgi:ATP-dependent RNA helicase DDX18/HAS1
VSHALKDIFNVHQLDLQQVALSFGFSHPPKVELNLRATSNLKKKNLNKNVMFQKNFFL